MCHVVLEGEKFVQDHGKAVNIGALVKFFIFAEGLFGGHIGGCSDEGAKAGGEDALFFLGDIGLEEVLGLEGSVGFFDGGGGIDLFGDTPIHHHDLAKLADDDIGGLEVAVDQALLVGEENSAEDFLKDLDAVGEGVAFVGGRIAVLEALDDIFEGLTFDVLHDEEVAAFCVDADVVDGGDIGVFKLPVDLDLFEEAQEGCLVFVLVFEAFDGDEAVDIVVFDEIDFARRAFTEGADAFVAFAIFFGECGLIVEEADFREDRGIAERACGFGGQGGGLGAGGGGAW